jgi:hypothetical protein
LAELEALKAAKAAAEGGATTESADATTADVAEDATTQNDSPAEADDAPKEE